VSRGKGFGASRFFAIERGLSLRRQSRFSEFASDEAEAGARTRGHEGGR